MITEMSYKAKKRRGNMLLCKSAQCCVKEAILKKLHMVFFHLYDIKLWKQYTDQWLPNFRGLGKGRIGEAKGAFWGEGMVELYDTVMVHTWHHAFVKTRTAL